jgi:hypothetical protein
MKIYGNNVKHRKPVHPIKTMNEKLKVMQKANETVSQTNHGSVKMLFFNK